MGTGIIRRTDPVAVEIDVMFEDSEYTEPAKAFKAAGHKLTHIGLKKNTRILEEYLMC